MSDIQKYNPEELMNKLMSHDFPEVLEKYSENDLENNLAVFINELIDKDFNKLVNLLYRIDISEQKLKIALQNEDKTISSGKTFWRSHIFYSVVFPKSVRISKCRNSTFRRNSCT